MSIPVRLDYMLEDGSIKENVYLFTISYGNSTKDTRNLLNMINECKNVLINELKKEIPKHYAIRDEWLLTARMARVSGTDNWFDIVTN